MTNTTEKKESKVYELGYLVISSISEEKVGDEVAKIKAVLAKYEASVVSEEAPKMRKLAYTMTKKIGTANKRFDSAYFGWVKFEMPPTDLPKVKKEVEENTNILRALLITTVREHTLLSEKLNLNEKGEETPKVAAPVAISAEELDKSIDKTVEELAV